MSSSSVFRKVSLDRLASPEQLDQLMQVTDPRGWVALLALGAVLSTAAMWGFIGSLPETVSGVGILVKSGGVFQVVPTSGGRVADMAVSVGEVVQEGQIVARLEQPELANQVQQAQASLAALREQHAMLVRFDGQGARLEETYLGQQRRTLEQSIAASEQVVQWLAEKVAAQEQLVDRGLVTRSTLISTRQQADATREKISDARSQLSQLEARAAGTRNDAAEQERASAARLAEQEAAVTELERRLAAASQVIAPYTGRILELMAERGSVVGPGEPLLSLDLEGRAVKDLEAVIYVSSVYGKQVKRGMQIQIAPATVKQEEFGYMIGRVTYVSDFPATTRGMQRVLKNDKLVSTLSGQDAPYEVRADLVVDPSTASHYRWTSSLGPPLEVHSGTLASANIAVRTKRPVELVIPLVKRYTGL